MGLGVSTAAERCSCHQTERTSQAITVMTYKPFYINGDRASRPLAFMSYLLCLF